MGINAYHTSQKIISNSKGSDSFLTKEQTQLVINHLSEVTYFNMSDIQEDICQTLMLNTLFKAYKNGFIET